jgi:hypothetical protein
VPIAQSSHAPSWQVPSRPQVDIAWAAHGGWPAGEGPLATLAHIPSIPHAMQGPAHAVLQQTPSAQNPLWHALSVWHGAPRAPRHAPPMHA